MLSRILLLLSFLLAFASNGAHAQMTTLGVGNTLKVSGGGGGIGAPTLILSNYFNPGGTNITTGNTSADAPIGTLVVLCVDDYNNDTITGIVDSASNPYTFAAGVYDATGAYAQIWFAVLSNDLPLGGNFVISGTFPTGIYISGVLSISGATNGLDKTNTASATSGAASTSLPTGTLAQASEIIIGALNASNGSGVFLPWTEGAGFATLIQTGTGGNAVISYQIVSSTTGVTWAPSWGGGTADYSAALATFKH